LGSSSDPSGKSSGSYKHGASTAGSETMTRTMSPNDNNEDLAVIAVKQLVGASNPGLSGTQYQQSFSYDLLGNLLTVASGATTSITSSPYIADSIPVTERWALSVTSDSFSYTVPSGGTNKVLLVTGEIAGDKRATLSATQNGAALTCQSVSGSFIRGYP